MNYLTIAEAATRIRVSKRTMYRLVSTYAVAHHRVGDRVVIRVADLEAYMESNRVASNREIELRAASVA